MNPRNLLLLTVAVCALALGPAAYAAWTEPTSPAPAGNIAPPISTESTAQTKAGSLTVTGGVAAQTGAPSSGGTIIGTLRGTAGTAAVGGVTAGVRGESPTAAGGSVLHAGVYGTAATNQGQSVGVYGSNGGSGNAWAALFNGNVGADSSVFVLGPLTAAGWGRLGTGTFDGFSAGDLDAGGTLNVTTHAGANAIGLLGELAAPATAGYGLFGAVTPTFCDYSFHPCGGVVGNYGFAGSTAEYYSGIASGFFYGPLNIEGTLTDSYGPFPRSIADLTGPTFRTPAHLGRVTPGSLLGTFNVGASLGKRLVVDGSGLWVGARRRIRTSDGLTLVNAAGPTDGGLAFDGKYLWLADASVAPNVLRRISTADGLDAQTFPLPAGMTFAPSTDVYFDGSSVWAVTCQQYLGTPYAFFSEFTRFDASGAESIANPRSSNPISNSSGCTEKTALAGMRLYGRSFLVVSYGTLAMHTYEYTATSIRVANSRTFEGTGIPFVLAHFFDHSGPGWTSDGDTIYVSGTRLGVLELSSLRPLSFATNSAGGGDHMDWIVTDGAVRYGVDASVSPPVLRTTTGALATLPVGSTAGPIVFDGTFLWIGGINGDTNVYKYSR